MKKVYLSGPITHHIGDDPFAPAEERLKALGYEVLNPKKIPACPNVSCELLPHEKEMGFVHSWACYLRYDLAAMLTECDSILMLDGWQDSHGAMRELETAIAVKMDVFFMRDLGLTNHA